MRKSPVFFLILSLLLPMAGALSPSPTVHAQATEARASGRKMIEDLYWRARSARTGNSAEKTRVILNLSNGATAFKRLRQTLKGVGGSVSQELDALGQVVADIPVSRLEELSANYDVSWMSEDQPVRSLSTDNTSHVEITTGASKVLPLDNSQGVGSGVAGGGAGTNVGIAVLDSGISPADAAEFVGYQKQQSGGLLGIVWLTSTQYVQSYSRILKHIDFTGEGYTNKNNGDVYGHGTHTAGIAAGTGQSSEDYAKQHAGAPTYGGVATNANLVDVRVLNSQGMGTVSNVIAGINWTIQNKDAYKIRVMNLSLGAPITQSYKTDPLCIAVGKAVDAGIVVVVAAGNWGKDSAGNTIYGGILSPANSPKVITVGASNTQQTNGRWDDTVTSYSSRGPTLVDGLIKPDLVAPGNRTGSAETLTSSPSPSNNYSTTGGGGLIGGLVQGNTSTNVPQATGTYQILSGTSFAAPVVSGTVALMLEANPSLTPKIVKALLMRTAQRLPIYEGMVMTHYMSSFERIITEGAGELNASAALTLAKAIRQDANKAVIGDTLIKTKNVTYSTLGLDAPIAGQSIPLNNGLVWVEGVAFTDKLLLTNGYQMGNGSVLASGFVVADGYQMPDGSYVFSNGYVLSSDYILSSGYILSSSYVYGSGYVLSSGYILSSEYGCADGTLSNGTAKGWTFDNQSTWASNIVDPSSYSTNEEQVMIQGETAIPMNVLRLRSNSPLFPHR